ncbi:MAG: isoprenylcysteine carboxylmethyltransferase family protein [Terracidiphilus sp.]|jgi:protein-S-isoprenylcysteine O-methyltransferase Ste14
MKASAIEFRLRMLINMVIVCLGLWAPWNEAWGVGRRIPLLVWLPLELSRKGVASFSVAAPAVIAAGAVMAGAGAALRVWGTAYLGANTVKHGEMKAGEVLADGPFRYVRNPLYIGLWFVFAALALLMPASGALFALAAVTVFLFRLILGEEAFLSGQLGLAYQDYLRAVPRLIPRLRTALPATGRKPLWLQAVLTETTPIGIFAALAFFSWSYNDRLMAKVIIVSFGLSLVTRALLPGAGKGIGRAE